MYIYIYIYIYILIYLFIYLFIDVYIYLFIYKPPVIHRPLSPPALGSAMLMVPSWAPAATYNKICKHKI